MAAERPRREAMQKVADFASSEEAYAACDAARALPEPQRTARQRELRPMLKRYILANWQVPNHDTDTWLARIVERQFILPSRFRPMTPPAPDRS